jgi:hypothetical protein
MLLLSYNPTRRVLTEDVLMDIAKRAHGEHPNGCDVHKMAAEYIFNTPYDYVTNAQRNIAKTESYWFWYSTPGWGIPARRLTMNEASTRRMPDHPAEQLRSQVEQRHGRIPRPDGWITSIGKPRYLGMDMGDPAGDKISIGRMNRTAPNSGIQAFNAGLMMERLEVSLAKLHESMSKAAEQVNAVDWTAMRERFKGGMAGIQHHEGRIINGHMRHRAMLDLGLLGTTTGRIRSSDGPVEASGPREIVRHRMIDMDFSRLEARTMMHIDSMPDFLFGLPDQIPRDSNVFHILKSRGATRGGMRLMEFDRMNGITTILRDEPWISDEEPKEKFAKALKDSRKAKAKKRPSNLLARLVGKL